MSVETGRFPMADGRTMEVETEDGAACWASYIFNGDASGLEDAEVAEADAWLANLGEEWSVSDIDGKPFFDGYQESVTYVVCRVIEIGEDS